MNNVVTRTLVLLAASTAFVLVMAFALPPAPTTLASTNQEDMAGHDMSDMAMTVDSEEAFITGMLPHHQEAVDSARAVLETTERPEVRDLAENIIATQTAEIETLTGWLEQHYPDARAAAYTPMMQDLEGLAPEEADRSFLEGMVVHHQGAIQMAQSYLDGDFEKRSEVTEMAEAVVSAQEGEIAQMEGWLADGYGETDAEHDGH